MISVNENGIGGFKEVIFMITGQGAYSKLKYESGVHRVQRVPETESGAVKTPVQLLTERIAKIQTELPQRSAALNEDEAAFLEAAEEQYLASQRPMRRSPFFRR